MTFQTSEEVIECKIAGHDVSIHYIIPDRFNHSRMSIWTIHGEFIYKGAVLSLLQIKTGIEKWERNQ